MKSFLELLHGCPKLLELDLHMLTEEGIAMNDLLNLIKEIRMMTKLTIRNSQHTNVNCEELMAFSSTQPSMFELNLLSHRMKSLKKLAFVVSTIDQLVSALGSEWKHVLSNRLDMVIMTLER